MSRNFHTGTKPDLVGVGRYAGEETALGAGAKKARRKPFVEKLEALLVEEGGEPEWARQFARYTASVLARRAGKEAAAEMIFRSLPPAPR